MGRQKAKPPHKRPKRCKRTFSLGPNAERKLRALSIALEKSPGYVVDDAVKWIWMHSTNPAVERLRGDFKDLTSSAQCVESLEASP